MNLFVTGPSPTLCARAHCDVHLIKMATEAAQLLSTTHHLTGRAIGYAPTHPNHPCAIWIRESAANYEWAYLLYRCLLTEYEFRFGKQHGAGRFKHELRRLPNLPRIDRTPWAQCVAPEFQQADTFAAYRLHIRAKLLEWPRRPRPVRTTFTKRVPPSFLSDLP
uniref:DNA binding protein n=1 Tax=Pseudomonas phage HRDY3 TaxID=3236930 RepID=A0AB39CE50_9VIRU